MNIIQFLRILWAHKWITAVAVASSLVGGVLVLLVVPPIWQAHTRIVLDNIKADPLTGQSMGPNASAYAATQVELIKDYTVAGKAADQLGWLTDPTVIEAYKRRPKRDVSDFRHWVAQLIIDRTDAELVPGTNILEITFTDAKPSDAKAVADALTKAYVDAAVEYRRDNAARNADWFEGQEQKAKADLDAASQAEADYQRQTGVILQDDKTDVDSARLRALSSEAAAGAPVFAPITNTASSAGAELVQVDAAIAQAVQTLGPNHPQLQALRIKRAALATEAAQEQASARAASIASASGVGALDRAMASEKTKVLGQSAALEHLKQLHADVEIRRDQFDKTAARAADLRQEAMLGDAGLTVLGPASSPQKPKFPNKPLIVGGSLGLGLASGVLLGLLIELLGRRVRGAEDLRSIGAPVLAVIPRASSAKSRRASSSAWTRLPVRLWTPKAKLPA